MKTQGNRENILSPYALWGLAGPRRRRRTSCVRRLSSFDDRQAMYEASCRCKCFSLVSMTTKHAQYAWKWMYIHAQAPRIAEPKHSQQIDRVRGDDVLAKEHCTSVIVGYGVKMKRRLCVSVQCAGCYFFSLKLTKTSSIRDRLLLSSKRSSLHCIA